MSKSSQSSVRAGCGALCTFTNRNSTRLGPLVAAAGALAVGAAASAGVPNYQLVGSFDAPAGAWDILPDGRLITIGGEGGDDVFIQSTLNGSAYGFAGEIATATPIASFGASFLAVSPSGSTVAIGDNNFSADNSVYTFSVGDLAASTPAPTQRIISPNFSATFADDETLFVTGADSQTFASGVYRVDLTTNTSSLVIDDFGGASAGVTTDGSFLYTGNGFDFSPGGSVTGEVRAIDLTAVDGSGPLVSFEQGMTPVASALSAGSLGFDGSGNLLIGGGDSSGEIDFAGVIDGDRLAAALAGGPPASGVDLALSPDPDFADSYLIRFNEATGELLVAANGTVYRFIPSPGGAGLLALAGASAVRRRRRG